MNRTLFHDVSQIRISSFYVKKGSYEKNLWPQIQKGDRFKKLKVTHFRGLFNEKNQDIWLET